MSGLNSEVILAFSPNTNMFWLIAVKALVQDTAHSRQPQKH